MERLTDKKEAEAQRREYENRLKNGYPRNIPEERFLKLAAYEDTGLEPEEVEEHEAAYIEIMTRTYGPFHQKISQWLQAEKDGRLVVLPCKDDTVFTIEEDFFNCDQCKHKADARYHPSIGRISCDFDNNEHCPLSIKEHEVEGFEISFREGTPVVSLPGAYGYEGLETYSGFDGKCYYTSEEAEAALKKREEADNEAD